MKNRLQSCACGHRREQHAEKAPRVCRLCGCEGFERAKVQHAKFLDSSRPRVRGGGPAQGVHRGGNW